MFHVPRYYVKGYTECMTTSKNERKRLTTRQSNSHFQYRQCQKANCSINMIPYAVNPFKHCGH